MDDEEIIPLKVLPHAGLIAYPYEDLDEMDEYGNETHPNNVLTAGIDRLKKVTLVGKDDSGEFYFASSLSDIQDVKRDLMTFYKFLCRLEMDNE